MKANCAMCHKQIHEGAGIVCEADCIQTRYGPLQQDMDCAMGVCEDCSGKIYTVKTLFAGRRVDDITQDKTLNTETHQRLLRLMELLLEETEAAFEADSAATKSKE